MTLAAQAAAQATVQTAVQSATKTAYLLVTHGSRDPRSQAGAEQLVAQLRSRFDIDPAEPTQPGAIAANSAANSMETCVAIDSAVLELGPAPLHIQIEQFAQQVIPLGVTRIKLLPLFLLPGIHVREDLPEQLELARDRLAALADPAQANPTAIALELLPHLGAEATLLPVLQAQQQALLHQFAEQYRSEPLLVGASVGAAASHSAPPYKPLTVQDVDWALLAHGSRRVGALGAIAELAHAVGARPAYWVGSPNLVDCVTVQRNRGHEHQPRPLGCLSYFLFEGGITDRLTAQLESVQPDHKAGIVAISEPLSAFPALVDAVADVMMRSPSTAAEICS